MTTKKKPMRRKNRQIKMTIDIPEMFESDEQFMENLMMRMDKMPDGIWQLEVAGVGAPISAMRLGDVEINPEEEED